MKLKQTGFLIVALILATNIFAQTEVEKLVNEGIEYHDKGDYTKAIETYCKYITQSGNKNSEKWIAENKTKLDAFGDWLANPDN